MEPDLHSIQRALNDAVSWAAEKSFVGKIRLPLSDIAKRVVVYESRNGRIFEESFVEEYLFNAISSVDENACKSLITRSFKILFKDKEAFLFQSCFPKQVSPQEKADSRKKRPLEEEPLQDKPDAEMGTVAEESVAEKKHSSEDVVSQGSTVKNRSSSTEDRVAKKKRMGARSTQPLPDQAASSSAVGLKAPLDLKKVSSAVYSDPGGTFLILCDFTKNIATITLKLDTGYIKLRNLGMRLSVKSQYFQNISLWKKLYSLGSDTYHWVMHAVDPWISFGCPPQFSVSLPDLEREMVSHFDDSRFGPFPDIVEGVKRLKELAGITPLHVVERSDQIPQGMKLTTRMNPQGKIEPLGIGSILGQGTEKKVSVAETRGQRPWARGKGVGAEKESAGLTAENLLIADLRKLRMPHIISSLSFRGQNLMKTRMQMPLLEEGTLFDFAEKCGGDKWKLLGPVIDIAEGISFMHEHGFTHNDVKSSNVLVGGAEDGYEGVVSDLGNASRASEQISIGGTYPDPQHAAKIPGDIPEGPPLPSNDCWAFGVLLYQTFIAGDETIGGLSWSSGKYSILAQARLIRDDLLQTAPQTGISIRKLIADLLSEDPAIRPTMKEVYERLCAIRTVHDDRMVS